MLCFDGKNVGVLVPFSIAVVPVVVCRCTLILKRMSNKKSHRFILFCCIKLSNVSLVVRKGRTKYFFIKNVTSGVIGSLFH